MKSRVKLFLIQLLFDKKITFFPNIDNEKFWNTLVKIASTQIIIPAVFFKLKQRDLLGKIPNELNQYLQNIYLFNKSRNKVFIEELTLIENELNINKIDFVFFKRFIFIENYLQKKYWYQNDA